MRSRYIRLLQYIIIMSDFSRETTRTKRSHSAFSALAISKTGAITGSGSAAAYASQRSRMTASSREATRVRRCGQSARVSSCTQGINVASRRKARARIAVKPAVARRAISASANPSAGSNPGSPPDTASAPDNAALRSGGQERARTQSCSTVATTSVPPRRITRRISHRASAGSANWCSAATHQHRSTHASRSGRASASPAAHSTRRSSVIAHASCNARRSASTPSAHPPGCKAAASQPVFNPGPQARSSARSTRRSAACANTIRNNGANGACKSWRRVAV